MISSSKAERIIKIVSEENPGVAEISENVGDTKITTAMKRVAIIKKKEKLRKELDFSYLIYKKK